MEKSHGESKLCKNETELEEPTLRSSKKIA